MGGFGFRAALEAEGLIEASGFLAFRPQAQTGEDTSGPLDHSAEQCPPNPTAPVVGGHIEVANPPGLRQNRVRIPVQTADTHSTTFLESDEESLPGRVEAVGPTPPFVHQPAQKALTRRLTLRHQRAEDPRIPPLVFRNAAKLH